jgi:hypothetical protein
MTEPDRKFEEEIRRALYAAGDLIVPAGDGLNKIRDRAARRPFAFGWLLAYAAHLPRRLVHGGRVAASEVAATMHGYSSLGLVFASARRWPGKARHVLRTPSVWLRPVLASATALILVIGVTFAIPRLRQQVTAQLASAFGNSNNPQGPGNSPGGGALPGGVQSSGATQLRPGAATHMPGKPWLATMPASSTQCRGQGSRRSSGTGTGRHAGGTGTIPPSEGPGPGQTVGAGTNGGVANSISAIHLNVAPPGDIGPLPVGVTCPPSVKPTTRPTTPVATPPPTTPYSPPPTTPTSTPISPPPTSPPPTSPPPTSPPPTSPPPTSPPPTSTSPATSTSSANSPASTGSPTESATPGG